MYIHLCTLHKFSNVHICMYIFMLYIYVHMYIYTCIHAVYTCIFVYVFKMRRKFDNRLLFDFVRVRNVRSMQQYVYK